MGPNDEPLGAAREARPVPEEYINTRSRQLYQKAYMIEFYGDDPCKAEDVFTFSIPPESEELNYTQRKSETKTFGGLHVDEYGIDAAKIVLSGSTVNQSLKMIYRGDKSSKWLSGEEEIYYFRDLIKKYRSLDNMRKKSKGKIIIYDLSKLNNTTGKLVENYWQAFPGDFKIRRSSDRPFTYKYSFEFTGVSLFGTKDVNSHGEPPELTQEKLGPSGQSESSGPLGSSDQSGSSGQSGSSDQSGSSGQSGSSDQSGASGQSGSSGQIQGLSRKSSIQSIMEGLVSALDFIDGINAQVNDVLDYVNQVSNLLKVMGNVMSYATNTLSGIIDSVGDSVVGVIDGYTNIVNGVNSIVSLPREIQLKTLNVGLEVMNATKGLAKATDDLAKNCRDMMFSEDGEYWEIPQEVLDQFGMSNEEFKDSIHTMLDQAENTANEMAAAAKSADIPDVTLGNPDPATGEQRLVLSYGHTIVMLKSTDTLESLANQYFGDPDKAIDIATYNGVASLDDLKPGDIIKLPITSKTYKMANNRIFARREDQDNYGKDILLTDDGFIEASNSGDYASVSGARNLSQAILLRLRESVAKRIRIGTYGIRLSIADPTAGIAYIISSIKLTMLSDPRVASVDNIRFSGSGDSLYISVDYTDINNASGNTTGRT
jgi:hypothetical protein